MNSFRLRQQIVLMGALAGFCGCADNEQTVPTECGDGTELKGGKCTATDKIECSPGTELRDGVCAAAQSDCGPGTKPKGDTCVADGSMVCGEGTSYDDALGECQPDGTVCPANHTLVRRVCVADQVRPDADVEEAAEPNGLGETTTLVSIKVPAADATVTAEGCIEAWDSNADGQDEPDLDSWLLQADGPSIVNISVEGSGGLSGGFMIDALDQQLAADGYFRAGVNLLGERAERSLYLPKAGLYLLTVSDGRTLAGSGQAPDKGRCYWMEISGKAVPTPEPLTVDAVTAKLDGPRFYSYTAEKDAVLTPSVTTDSAGAVPALVGMVDGAYVSSAERNAAGETKLGLANLDADQKVTLVVDMVQNTSVRQPNFTLLGGLQRLAGLKDTIEITHSLRDPDWIPFEAAAGEVVRIQLAAPARVGLDVQVFDRSAKSLGLVCGKSSEPGDTIAPCNTADFNVRVAESGTHYVQVYNREAGEGDIYELTATVERQMPAALELGKLIETTILPEQGSRFLVLEAPSAKWLALSLENLRDFVGAPVVRWYPASGAGVLGAKGGLGMLKSWETQRQEVFLDGAAFSVLIEVDDAGDASSQTDGAPDFAVRTTDMPFIDTGLLKINEPLNLGEVKLGSDEAVRVVARATEGQVLTVQVDPGETVLPTITEVDRFGQPRIYASGDTATDTPPGPGRDAQLAALVPYADERTGNVLFTIVAEGAGGAAKLNAAITQAATYERSSDTATFSSVCPPGGKGEAHAMKSDGSLNGRWDEGLSESPIDLTGQGYTYFGQAIENLTVSSNGWMTTKSDYAGGAEGNPSVDAAPGALAPFWTDLEDVSVCTLKTDDAFTVEWNDGVLGIQATLRKDGSITFAYNELAAQVMRTQLAGGLFHPTEDPLSPLGLVSSLLLDAQENVSRFTPAPALVNGLITEAAQCDPRMLVGSCAIGGRCFTFHGVDAAEAAPQCTGAGGAFSTGPCGEGFAYCAEPLERGPFHLWVRGATCAAGQLACTDDDIVLPEPVVITCEDRPAQASCTAGNTCTSYHDHSEAQLETLENLCGGNGGSWKSDKGCLESFTYCAEANEDEPKLRKWTRDGTCRDDQQVCKGPEAKEPEKDCSRPPSLATCTTTSGLCLEIYDASSQLLTRCPGTLATGATCPTGYYFCKKPGEAASATRTFRPYTDTSTCPAPAAGTPEFNLCIL